MDIDVSSHSPLGFEQAIRDGAMLTTESGKVKEER